MIVKTRIFELSNGSYKNLSGLAQAMGISVSQIYRIRQGKRRINQKFIVGAMRAFPQYKLDELFYLVPEPGRCRSDRRVRQREASRSDRTRVIFGFSRNAGTFPVGRG
jgi:transcriptional regulator with XRE-family HTH domain